jgi:hypothetical protein
MRIGEAVPVASDAGKTAGAAGAEPGDSVCGSVARFAEAGAVGRNSGPFWPQAASSEPITAARASRGAAARILERFNIHKLY